MQSTINAILAPFQKKGIDAGAEFNGKYWEIWIGSHAGGREDGVSLANELANLVRRESRPKTAYVPEVEAVQMSAPALIEIPAFIALEPEAPEPPETIRDLIRENEPHGEAQDRLLALYRSLGNKLVMGLASEQEGRLHSRLHGSLQWIARGAVEVTGKA